MSHEQGGTSGRVNSENSGVCATGGVSEEENLSFAEERMWFLHQMNPQGCEYSITTAYRLFGELSISALRAALECVVKRQEMLRSCFVSENGRPRLRVYESVELNFRIISTLGNEIRDIDAWVGAEMRAETHRPFSLEIAPLFRVLLIRVAAQEHVLCASFHHIIADGWSIGVFYRELSSSYEAAVRGLEIDGLSPRMSHAEAVRQEKLMVESEKGLLDLEYWTGRLKELPELELPMVQSRLATRARNGKRHEHAVDVSLVQALGNLARKTRTSLYMIFCATFAALLNRYSDQQEVIIGSPVSNRSDSRLQNVMGLFVNSMVLRIDIERKFSFLKLLSHVRELVLDGLDRQSVPFDRIVKTLVPDRALNKNPLFQVMFALQNVEPFQMLGLRTVPVAAGEDCIRFDLECTIFQKGNEILIRFVHDTSAFASEAVATMLRHYCILLRGFVSDPERPISDVELLSSIEASAIRARERVPHLGSTPVCLHELFRKQAIRSPQATAIRITKGAFTFQELDQWSSGLASYLCELGVCRGDIVGVFTQRSVELVVSTLAILKTGAAFLPMNPADPVDRLKFILSDAKVRALLADDTVPYDLDKLVTVERVRAPSAYPFDRTFAQSEPMDLAYVIYTSGTTGKPKAVCIEHRNIVNTLLACQEILAFSPEDFGLVLAPSTFDVFYYELLSSMLAGGCSYLVSRDELYDTGALRRLLMQATSLQAVPGLMEHLLATLGEANMNQCPKMRVVMTGGDVVPPRLLNTLKEKFCNARVVVTYGPTETAIFCTLHVAESVTGEDCHLIGTPLPGTVVRVANNFGEPVPDGFAGEIWIGGAGVARGYLNRDEETGARFVVLGGERFYRSGDRARWRLDGCIEFLGRVDSQVKVRGFRIELGEVEKVLESAPYVDRAVVLARGETPSNRRLVAYATFKEDALCSEVERIESERIGYWRSVFEETYRSSAKRLEGDLDFTGWNSSYDGEPIPVEEMQEWLAVTLAGVLARVRMKARQESNLRVLDIGCGTGLFLLSLAKLCSHYVGCDFSDQALNDLRKITRLRKLNHVELVRCEADSIAEGGEKFDFVLINSVTQYLPSGAYLRRVLESTLCRVREGGFVFVGDVRNLSLLTTMHVATEASRHGIQSPEALLDRAYQRATGESELVLHPAYFLQIAREIAGISHIEVQPKSGRHGNELTRYRFDVFLHRGLRRPVVRPHWHDWGLEGWTVQKVNSVLGKTNDRLALRGVPNLHLQPDLEMHKVLAAAAKHTLPVSAVGEPASIDDLRDLAARMDFDVEVSCLRGSTDGSFDVIFHPHSTESRMQPEWPTPGEGVGTLANDPVRRVAQQNLSGVAAEFLRNRVPEYMVPALIVPINRLPLNTNGKVNYSALPIIPLPNSVPNRLPQSNGELLVADVFARVLGRIGFSANDDFFEIGGTSLLAIQVAVALRVHHKNFAPQVLFELRTIERIGAWLDKMRLGMSVNRTRQCRQVEGSLSELEVKRTRISRHNDVPILTKTSNPWSEGVLLTGATGFLGIHLLEALLHKTSRTIICLVRARSHDDARRRLFDQFHWYFPDHNAAERCGNVSVLASDITDSRLGLKQSEWETLVNQVDHVIHAAADVRHVAKPEQVFATNLGGTINLLKVVEAAKKNAKLHYVSTTSVKGFVPDNLAELTLFEDQTDVGQLIGDVYSESKLATEREIGKFFDRGGLGTVLRVGTIAPHSETARFQRNIKDHFFARYLRSVLELGVTAEFEDQGFSLIPVDVMARAILCLSGCPEALRSTFHLKTAYRISHRELVGDLCSLGYDIGIVSYEELLNSLAGIAHDSKRADAVSGIISFIDAISRKPVYLDCSWTDGWLKQLDFSFPKPSKSWFTRFIFHGIDQGYFPPPPTDVRHAS